MILEFPKRCLLQKILKIENLFKFYYLALRFKLL